jgi:hypothetical protein
MTPATTKSHIVGINDIPSMRRLAATNRRRPRIPSYLSTMSNNTYKKSRAYKLVTKPSQQAFVAHPTPCGFSRSRQKRTPLNAAFTFDSF